MLKHEERPVLYTNAQQQSYGDIFWTQRAADLLGFAKREEDTMRHVGLKEFLEGHHISPANEEHWKTTDNWGFRLSKLLESWLVSHPGTLEVRRETDAYGCTTVEYLLPNGEIASLACVTQESLAKSLA